MMYPMEECPQFSTCSAPLCPLDLGVGRLKLKGEPNCVARLTTRQAIAERHLGKFPDGVMTHRERVRSARSVAAKARWDAMSPEDQAAKLEMLKKLREPRVAGTETVGGCEGSQPAGKVLSALTESGRGGFWSEMEGDEEGEDGLLP